MLRGTHRIIFEKNVKVSSDSYGQAQNKVQQYPVWATKGWRGGSRLLSANALTGEWSTLYIVCRDSLPVIPNELDWRIISETGALLTIESVEGNPDSPRYVNVIARRVDPGQQNVLGDV